MTRRVLALLVGLLTSGAVPAAADTVAVAHHTFTILGVANVASSARPQNTHRRMLGLINDGGTLAYCTVDDTTATASNGLRLAAAGTTGDRVFFDQNVPIGAVSCISSAAGVRILIIEGR